MPFSLFKLKAKGELSTIIISFKSLPNFDKSFVKKVFTKEQCSLHNLWMHSPFSSIKFINGIAYFETDAVKITNSYNLFIFFINSFAPGRIRT